MFRTLTASIVATVLLMQLAGCHYYVSAVPRIIISSEPFQPPAPAVSPPAPVPAARGNPSYTESSNPTNPYRPTFFLGPD